MTQSLIEFASFKTLGSREVFNISTSVDKLSESVLGTYKSVEKILDSFKWLDKVADNFKLLDLARESILCPPTNRVSADASLSRPPTNKVSADASLSCPPTNRVSADTGLSCPPTNRVLDNADLSTSLAAVSWWIEPVSKPNKKHKYSCIRFREENKFGEIKKVKKTLRSHEVEIIKKMWKDKTPLEKVLDFINVSRENE